MFMSEDFVLRYDIITHIESVLSFNYTNMFLKGYALEAKNAPKIRVCIFSGPD